MIEFILKSSKKKFLNILQYSKKCLTNRIFLFRIAESKRIPKEEEEQNVFFLFFIFLVTIFTFSLVYSSRKKILIWIWMGFWRSSPNLPNIFSLINFLTFVCTFRLKWWEREREREREREKSTKASNINTIFYLFAHGLQFPSGNFCFRKCFPKKWQRTIELLSSVQCKKASKSL